MSSNDATKPIVPPGIPAPGIAPPAQAPAPLTAERVQAMYENAKTPEQFAAADETYREVLGRAKPESDRRPI